MPVPFLDLKAQTAEIREEVLAGWTEALDSAGFIGGPHVAAFESEYAAYIGVEHCVGVGNGTDAIELALRALGVGAGDEVILPANTFVATAEAVWRVGARPVLVDVDPARLLIDPVAVEAAITERTAGIMPVHLYGHPADVSALGAIAEKHGVQLFEDAAQAHGATWQGAPVGSFGTFGMFSLYPTKNMTSGEGGMVSCATPEVVRKIQVLRNQGMEKRYENEVVGFNARMTDIHAAIGRVQLGKVGDWTARRQANAEFLSANLEGVGVPVVVDGATHVWHQYTIRVPHDRDGFAAALASEHGVGSGVYYPIPNHQLPSFGLDFELPATREACDQVLSLPVHPALSQADLEQVVAGVNALAKAGA